MENWVTGAAEEERLGQMWEGSKVQGDPCWVSQSKPAQNSSTAPAQQLDWTLLEVLRALSAATTHSNVLCLILEFSAPHAVVF